MKNANLLLVATLAAFAITFIHTQAAMQSTDIPVVVWTSGASDGHSVERHAVRAPDVAAFLNDAAASASAELVVLFFEEQLSMYEFSMYGNVYGNGVGAFTEVFAFTHDDNADVSSVVFEAGASALAKRFGDDVLELVSASVDGNAYVARQGDASASSVAYERIVDELREGGALDNGVCDVVAVYFAPRVAREQSRAEYLAAHGAFVGELTDALRAATDVSVVSAYTAQRGAPDGLAQARTTLELVQEENFLANSHDSATAARVYMRSSLDTDTGTNSTTVTTSDTDTYWPGGLLEALFAMLVTLMGLCVGCCCTLNIGTPDRYEMPKRS